jgi:hypothetical protein
METQKRKFTLTQKVGIGLIAVGIATAAFSPFTVNKLVPINENIIIENPVRQVIIALPHAGPYTLVGKGIVPTKVLEDSVSQKISKRAAAFADLFTLSTLLLMTGGALTLCGRRKERVI